MLENRIRVAPNTVAYADGEKNKLVVEFAIPGAPTDTIDLKILPDSVHLTAPARDIEYVSALALAWPVKPDKAEAIYEHGLLRRSRSERVARKPRLRKSKPDDPLT
jgi:HSP20 family molecular chaperone IbpA